MGLVLDKTVASERFEEALALARSDAPLPEEWVERTLKVASAASKTFTPLLGTALLAKATDHRVDTLSLAAGTSHKSYSARNLAKDVLVPHCLNAGVDIRTTGAEPLNNQPFLRAPRVTPELKVRKKALPDLLFLCECLTRADFLEGDDSLD